MLVKVNVPLKTLDGQTMKDNIDGQVVDATLKLIAVNAILSPVQKESGIEKVKKFNLAQRIYDNDTVELSVEEVSLIKERIGELFPPLVVGQAFKMLDN